MKSIIEYFYTLNLNQQKQKLILIYDGFEQLKTNPFTHQLFYVLSNNFNIKLMSIDKLSKQTDNLFDFKIVLVISRLRNWSKILNNCSDFLLQKKVFFYDQDPWEAYHDKGTCRGIYEKINIKVSPVCFFVTSSWWAGFISKKSNIPIKFVKMGILPKYCNKGKPFHLRKYNVGFQGLVHKHRLDFYNKIEKKGIKIELLKRESFFKFLSTVQNIKIFIYNDNKSLSINGRKQPLHGLWGKSLTVAGRGCFVIRNYDLAAKGYDIDELPTIKTFKNEREVIPLIQEILNRSDAENNALISKTVNKLKERNDWQSIINSVNELI